MAPAFAAGAAAGAPTMVAGEGVQTEKLELNRNAWVGLCFYYCIRCTLVEPRPG